MKKFSLTVLGVAIIGNLYILTELIKEILPNYYKTDWIMILWAILPLIYLGFFFIKTFSEDFYKKFKKTVNTISIGLICSLIIYLIPWALFYFSTETDPLGVSIGSLVIGGMAALITFIASLVVLIIDFTRGIK